MSFVDRFQVNGLCVGRVGIEHETHIIDASVRPRYDAHMLLPRMRGLLPSTVAVEEELSAGQVEFCNPTPLHVSKVKEWLEVCNGAVARIEGALGVQLPFLPYVANIEPRVAPNARATELARTCSSEVLRAGCAVSSFQVKVGMPSLEAAIQVVNYAHRSLEGLRRTYMSEERYRAYCMFALRNGGTSLVLPVIRSVAHLEEVARVWGFYEEPKNCHALVRIHVAHGAVEFRFPDATLCMNTCLEVVATCMQMCVDALGESFRERVCG